MSTHKELSELSVLDTRSLVVSDSEIDRNIMAQNSIFIVISFYEMTIIVRRAVQLPVL